jgi:hypothetical protein
MSDGVANERCQISKRVTNKPGLYGSSCSECKYSYTANSLSLVILLAAVDLVQPLHQQLTKWTGRRRKVRCLPSAADPSKCVACFRRRSRCLKHQSARLDIRRSKTTPVESRIAELESNVQQFNGQASSYTTQEISPLLSASSTPEAAVDPVKFGVNTASPIFSLLNNEVWRVLEVERNGVPDEENGHAISPTLPISPSRSLLKHERVCKILLKMLHSSTDIGEALTKQSRFWNLYLKHSLGATAGSPHQNIFDYAGTRLAGDNPIQIAKVAQLVAGGTIGTNTMRKIAWLVDRLILADIEYVSSLDGVECAFEQGKLLTDLGQVKSSW